MTASRLPFKGPCLSVQHRQARDERRALSELTARRDRAAVPLDDLPADRQTYARPLVLAATVETLEDREDPVEVLLVEADAVVRDGDATRTPLAAASRDLAAVDDGRADAHDGRCVLPMELQRVPDEVLKELAHLHGVALDDGQGL